MSKKIRIIVISVMFIASMITNIYLVVKVNKLSKTNNEIQSKLYEIKSNKSLEEKKITEEDKNFSNNEIDEKKDESSGTSQKENNSTKKKTTSSTKKKITSSTITKNQHNNNSSNHNNNKEVNELIGKWQYVNGEDITTYVFKEDGTLWINDEYVDKYSNNSAICDNCLTHIGLHEIQYMIKDEILYINFYKETMTRDLDGDGIKESKVYYIISTGSYVKAKKIS